MDIPIPLHMQQYRIWKTDKLNRYWFDGRYHPDIFFEPPPATMVNWIDVSVHGYLNPTDPVNLAIVADVDIEWDPQVAKHTLPVLKKYNVDLNDVGRGGGVGVKGVANKRISTISKPGFDAFIMSTLREFYGLPCFDPAQKGEGYLRHVELHNRNFKLGLENWTLYGIDAKEGDANPRAKDAYRMILNDKNPTTGTGWKFPLNDRGGMALNWNRVDYADKLLHTYTAWHHDWMYAMENWFGKMMGTRILCGSMWNGMSGGYRTNADYFYRSPTSCRTTTTGREIGAGPDSALHGPVIDSWDRMKDMWEAVTPPHVVLPMSMEYYELALATPPVTAEFIPDQVTQKACCSSDFGPNRAGAAIDSSWRFTVGKEDLKAPADVFKYYGIVLESSESKLLQAEKISGHSTTMIDYQPDTYAVKWAMDKAKYSIQTCKTGDDEHSVGTLDSLQKHLSIFNHVMRTKGMRGNSNFINGTQVYWVNPDYVVAYVVPRPIKTTTSPKLAERAYLQPKELMKHSVAIVPNPGPWPIGYRVRIKPDPEAKAAAAEVWAQHPEALIFEGTLSSFKTYLRKTGDDGYFKQKQMLARVDGFSDWFQEVFSANEGDQTWQ